MGPENCSRKAPGRGGRWRFVALSRAPDLSVFQPRQYVSVLRDSGQRAPCWRYVGPPGVITCWLPGVIPCQFRDRDFRARPGAFAFQGGSAMKGGVLSGNACNTYQVWPLVDRGTTSPRGQRDDFFLSQVAMELAPFTRGPVSVRAASSRSSDNPRNRTPRPPELPRGAPVVGETCGPKTPAAAGCVSGRGDRMRGGDWSRAACHCLPSMTRMSRCRDSKLSDSFGKVDLGKGGAGPSRQPGARQIPGATKATTDQLNCGASPLCISRGLPANQASPTTRSFTQRKIPQPSSFPSASMVFGKGRLRKASWAVFPGTAGASALRARSFLCFSNDCRQTGRARVCIMPVVNWTNSHR